MKKVIYIAPRFHTNQYAAVKSLIGRKVQVKYFVQNVEVLENYEDIVPTKIGYSKITDLLIKILNKNSSELQVKSMYMYLGIPPIFSLVSKLREFNPDLVILRERTIYSILCNMICNLLRIKTLLYTQEPLFTRKSPKGIKKIYISITKPFLPRNRITPVLGDASNGVREARTTFIPFVMSSGIKERLYLKGGKVNFLIVSKYQKIKRILETIEIFNKINSEGFMNWQLTVCGALDNKERQLVYDEIKIYINKNNLNDKIKLKYNIKHKDMKDEYMKSDVSILSSIRDYASVTPIEAMSYGLVNISSDGNGTNTYIRNQTDGYIFKSNDIDELYEIIKGLLINPTLIEEMGRMSLQNFFENYSQEIYADRLLNLYETIKK